MSLHKCVPIKCSDNGEDRGKRETYHVFPARLLSISDDPRIGKTAGSQESGDLELRLVLLSLKSLVHSGNRKNKKECLVSIFSV